MCGGLGCREGIGEGIFGVQEEDLGLRVLGCTEGIVHVGAVRVPFPPQARTDPPLWGRSWSGGAAFQRGGRRDPEFQRLGRAGGAIPGLRAAPEPPVNHP